MTSKYRPYKNLSDSELLALNKKYLIKKGGKGNGVSKDNLAIVDEFRLRYGGFSVFSIKNLDKFVEKAKFRYDNEILIKKLNSYGFDVTCDPQSHPARH